MLKNTIPIGELKEVIENKCSILSNWGLNYSYLTKDGLLKDRIIHFFRFDNLELKRKIEIVYCTKEISSLQAYLINYIDKEPAYIDFEKYISFNRLRFLLPNDEVVFFGNKQYEITYKIDEIVKVINCIKNNLTTEQWISIDDIEIVAKRSNAYAQFQISKSVWVEHLVEKIKKHESFKIVYNPIGQPPYENSCLCIMNKYNDVFQIMYGHSSRYDSGYGVYIMKNNKCVKSETIYDSRNVDNVLIKFCKKKVIYD